MGNFTVKNFTFKLLLLLPLLLLLWDTFVNVYYRYFDFSFVVQVLLFLLWGVEVWWVLKTRNMPLPVLVSAFVVIYLGFVIDKPLEFKSYVSNILWAALYTYLLRAYYLKSLKENTDGTREAGFGSSLQVEE